MRTSRIIALFCLMAAGAVPARAQAQGRDPGEWLARADTIADGRITRSEFRAMRAQLFSWLDRNGDGYLSRDDAPRLRRARQAMNERLDEMTRQFDVNRDGRVSRDEFVNGPARIFDLADANGDGVIDREELAAFRDAAAERRAGR